MDYTTEQQEDFKARAQAFQTDYLALKEKHGVELVHSIVSVPSPSGVFGLAISENIGDLKFKPVPSPFAADDSPDSPQEPLAA